VDALAGVDIAQLDKLLLSYSVFQLTYWDDPLGFVQDCIRFEPGEEIYPYQRDVLRQASHPGRIAVRGTRGLGKSALGAWLVLWWALTRDGEDWKVLTKASVSDQLTRFLWPEVHKWAARLRWELIGRPLFNTRDELQLTTLRLETGEASANTSDDPQKFEGGHADHLLVLFDEARSILDPIWRSALGMFTRPDYRWVAISTPGEEVGTFFQIFTGASGWDGWQKRHVTLAEALEAGAVTQEWADSQLAVADGNEADPFYQQQALGEFANVGTIGAIIPFTWVEKAHQRWAAWEERGRRMEDGRPSVATSIGFDVGGGTAGGDPSVIAIIYDYNKVGELYEYPVAIDPATATMELVAHAVALANQRGRPPIYGDAQGIGAGTVGRLIEMGYDARPFVASYGTMLLDAAGVYGFGNWRAAAWWLMREALDPIQGQDIALPTHEGLTKDLTTPRLKRIDSNQRRFVEAKEDLRKRLGRSPDCADAVLHGIIGPVLERERQQGQQVTYRVTDSSYRIGNY